MQALNCSYDCLFTLLSLPKMRTTPSYGYFWISPLIHIEGKLPFPLGSYGRFLERSIQPLLPDLHLICTLVDLGNGTGTHTYIIMYNMYICAQDRLTHKDQGQGEGHNMALKVIVSKYESVLATLCGGESFAPNCMVPQAHQKCFALASLPEM